MAYLDKFRRPSPNIHWKFYSAALWIVVAFGPTVTDDDPSHHYGEGAGIALKKYTNGYDADEETGPYFEVGDPVTNTGRITLTNVKVTDDQGVPVSCPQDKDTLAPGESLICEAHGTATERQYANMGTAPTFTVMIDPDLAQEDTDEIFNTASITSESGELAVTLPDNDDDWDIHIHFPTALDPDEQPKPDQPDGNTIFMPSIRIEP